VATMLRWSRSGRMRAAALRRHPQTGKVRGTCPQLAVRSADWLAAHASGLKPSRSSCMDHLDICIISLRHQC
jgi:hypothetical protein